MGVSALPKFELRARAPRATGATAKLFRTAADAAEFRFRVVRELAGFAALEAEWNELAHRCGKSQHGFQSHNWLHSWAQRYAETGDDLRIILAYAEDRLVLVWPLMASRRLGVRILSFMGEPLCQYHDALVDDEATKRGVVALAFAHIQTLPFDLLQLRRIRDDANLAAPLEAGGLTIERSQNAPYLNFVGVNRFMTVEHTLSAKMRADRRRRWRKLEALGEIGMRASANSDEAAALVGQAMAFKRKWALQSAQYAPSAFDSRFEACLRAALQPRDDHAQLRVFAIHCAGQLAGVEISYGYKGRLFGHVLAPDPELSRYGLGNILADAAIRDAFEQGYEVYDLLAPADAYKCAWTKTSVGVTDYSFAANWRGALYAAIVLRAVKKTALKIRDALPPNARRFLLSQWLHRGRSV